MQVEEGMYNSYNEDFFLLKRKDWRRHKEKGQTSTLIRRKTKEMWETKWWE